MASTRSPFPGMDPYLESHWQAVHAIFIAETWRALNRSLPPDLSATVEERGNKPSGGIVVVDAPYRMVVDADPVIERFIQIVNQDGQLITVVEFISPGNKRQPGLDVFLATRAELLNAGVHLVEIDLVRAGNWQALFKPHICPSDARSVYRVTIRTAGIPASAYLYPIHSHDQLPDIQIPLRPLDPKVMLSLQPMIEAIYSDGRFGNTLDYTRPLDPPLSDADQTYAAQRINKVG